MNNTPKVSVIMPVYNGEKYLKEAISSILNQTYSNFELIIINDGSVDRSIEIIKSFSDPRILFINNDGNKGLSYTRNFGIEKSSGEYIAWLDCDDISLPQRIEKQVGYLEGNPLSGLCSTNISYINTKGEVVNEMVFEKNDTPKEWQLIWGNPIAQSSVMLRKDVIQKNHLKYDPSYKVAEDYDFWCNLAMVSRIHRIEEVLVHYRVHDQGAYQSNKKLTFELSLAIVSRYVREISNQEAPEFFQNLTIYSEFIGIEFKTFDLVEVNNWLSSLFSSATKLWNWDKAEQAFVIEDIRHRFYSYYSHLPKRRKITGLLKLAVNLKWNFSAVIFKTAMRGIFHKIRRPFVPLKSWVRKYYGIICSAIEILIIRTLLRVRETTVEKPQLSQEKPLRILLAPLYHEEVAQNLRGGDDTVNGLLERVFKESGHIVEYAKYDWHYPNVNRFLKKIIGMPYVYSKIVNDSLDKWDIVIADAQVNYNIKHPRCINIYHYSFKGYSTLAGVNWDLTWKLKYRKLSAIQEQGAKNSYNIAVSDFQKMWLEKENVKVDAVIYNSINTESFQPLNIKETEKQGRLLFLGGYSYFGKGFDILEKLAKKGLKIDCVTNFAKEGDGLNYLHTVPHTEVSNVMNKYKIFVYPTRYDSCSMSVLEAMACGLPTITGNVGIGPVMKDVIPEFVVDGSDEKAIDEYYNKIQLIEKDYLEFSKKAREYIMNHHSFDTFRDKWLSVINSIKQI